MNSKVVEFVNLVQKPIHFFIYFCFVPLMLVSWLFFPFGWLSILIFEYNFAWNPVPKLGSIWLRFQSKLFLLGVGSIPQTTFYALWSSRHMYNITISNKYIITKKCNYKMIKIALVKESILRYKVYLFIVYTCALLYWIQYGIEGTCS